MPVPTAPDAYVTVLMTYCWDMLSLTRCLLNTFARFGNGRKLGLELTLRQPAKKERFPPLSN
ncbi:hypothetical protein D6833_01030 [Candidatus Parcubacteria bacterium]|nr:MAG: hypothetical protein D6833_01030 [Candidatus Parcubacteria bacterium]